MNSIEISNFKNFRHLRIDNLGKVNLIVGKNNAGESLSVAVTKHLFDTSHPLAGRFSAWLSRLNG